MSTKSTIFLSLVIIQFWIVFKNILILHTYRNAMSVVDMGFVWLILYFLVGIIGMSIKFFAKLRYDWVVYLLSYLTIIDSIYFLILHSPYYEHSGVLPIEINLKNINPITYYSELNAGPPPIHYIYVVIAYNIFIALLTYLISKIQNTTKT